MSAESSDRPTLSVVIPSYDEIDTIGTILERVAATPWDKEIVVVDDGSTDGTREFLREIAEGERSIAGAGGDPVPVHVVFQPENRGKGAAVRRGFGLVRGEVVVVQDADLEYDPDDYGALLDPILQGEADVVYGSRFLGGPQRVHFFWHYVGNRALTLLSNMLTNLKLTDMETCYKAFRRDVIEEIGPRLTSDRFGFEPEITARVARGPYRVYETPISYHGRDYDEGKKITWRDGLAALVHIVRFNVFAR